MYSYAMRERFNAGQLALLLNIRSFARAMASAKTNRVQLKFAQVRLYYRVDYHNVRSHHIISTAATNCSPSSYSPRHLPNVSCLYLQRVALFALDFASPERVEKVLRRLQMKSGSSSQNANDSVERVGAEEGREEEKSVSVVDLLNIVLSAYGSAIHEFRVGFSRPPSPRSSVSFSLCLHYFPFTLARARSLSRWSSELSFVIYCPVACVRMLNNEVAAKLLQMHLREEYEDLLEELARGQPYDGLKGRPLGSRVTVLSAANTLSLAVSLARPLALLLSRARTRT